MIISETKTILYRDFTYQDVEIFLDSLYQRHGEFKDASLYVSPYIYSSLHYHGNISDCGSLEIYGHKIGLVKVVQDRFRPSDTIQFVGDTKLTTQETFNSKKPELATERVPDSPLILTLPEGTEAFKGQIRASNGVLYKISVEKVEE
jgi:hypothetical protein